MPSPIPPTCAVHHRASAQGEVSSLGPKVAACFTRPCACKAGRTTQRRCDSVSFQQFSLCPRLQTGRWIFQNHSWNDLGSLVQSAEELFSSSGGFKSLAQMPLFAVHVCVTRCVCHEINMSELYLCPILQEKAQLKWSGACCPVARV